MILLEPFVAERQYLLGYGVACCGRYGPRKATANTRVVPERIGTGTGGRIPRQLRVESFPVKQYHLHHFARLAVARPQSSNRFKGIGRYFPGGTLNKGRET